MPRKTKKRLPADRPLTSSWQLLRQSVLLIRSHANQVLILALLPSLALQLGGIVLVKHFALGLALYALSILWLAVNMPVLYYFEVKTSRGESVPTGESYSRGLPHLWSIIVFSVLYGALVILGTICLIVPGFILFRRYALAPYYIVDRNMSIGDAMRRSAAVTKPVAGYIWGSVGVTLCVSIAASVAGLAFLFVPGLSGVVSSVLGLAALFVFPLRYVEVATRAGD